METYTHVIWDWNGTLFNDVGWCVSVVNSMLDKRSLKTLESPADYRSVFGFPVIDYYRRVGFDFGKETFEELAGEFIRIYHSADDNGESCRLYPNAEHVLNKLSDSGIIQVILSASEISNLTAQINNYNIAEYFDEILGISNIYAESKIKTGLDYISRKNVKNAVLIGDTIHDYEVAKALGAGCILIANGHQSRERLMETGVTVLNDIAEVLTYI